MEPVEFFANIKSTSTTIHVLSVVVGMGGALLADFLFNFYAKDKVLDANERKSLSRLSVVVWVALTGIILSGIALFLSDPAHYAASHKFITKMAIVAVLFVNGLFLGVFISPHLNDRGLLKFKGKRMIRQISHACGAISVVSWLTALGLGLLESIPVHFMHFLSLYLATVIVAIIVALIVERRSFSMP